MAFAMSLTVSRYVLNLLTYVKKSVNFISLISVFALSSDKGIRNALAYILLNILRKN